MSNFKLQFTLKQHTPLIHFQHDQAGATLRATELKPKLDRFLIENVFGGILAFEKYKKFLIGDIKPIEKKLKKIDADNQIQNKEKAKLKFLKEQALALDFKVRIEAPKKPKYYLFMSFLNNERKRNLEAFFESINKQIQVVAPSPFFANQDKIKFGGKYYDKNGNEIKLQKNQINIKETKLNELRYAVHTNEFIKGEIKSFNTNKINEKTLLETIEKNIPEFFLSTNFGTRQNKGFGSFTVTKINENKTKYIKKSDLESLYQFVYELRGKHKSISEIFSKIDKQYKDLKNNPAQKASKIRDYFNEKSVTWEKPAVTQKLIFEKRINPDNYRYVRALLGLAELHDYQQFNKRVKITHYETNGENKIERFQSPIFYKVIYDKIYLCVSKETHLEKIINQKFWFYRTSKLEKADEKDKLLLKAPLSFDLIDFLNYALNIEN